jgi:hypothetical protein
VSGCTTWQIVYNSATYSALSIVVQTAPNAAGGVPGSWSTFTAVTGINPNTATTEAVSTFGGPTSYFPWLRVQLTSATGAGTISGRLYGWRIPAVSSGGSVTIPTPVPVDGPTAAGSAPTTPPVLVAGQDGAPGVIRTLKTDASGRPIAVGAAASGAAAAGNPLLMAGWNGSTVQIPVVCDTPLAATVSTSGNTQLIAASGSTVIHLCEVIFTTTDLESVKLTSGTGSNCGTGTADLTPAFPNTNGGSFVAPFQSIPVPSGKALCFNQTVAQSTGIFILYAQN